MMLCRSRISRRKIIGSRNKKKRHMRNIKKNKKDYQSNEKNGQWFVVNKSGKPKTAI